MIKIGTFDGSNDGLGFGRTGLFGTHYNFLIKTLLLDVPKRENLLCWDGNLFGFGGILSVRSNKFGIF
jgi:hypothetical protein